MTKHECIAKMKGKKYLYEIDIGQGFGYGVNGTGTILADNDNEAKEFALICYPKATAMRKDHWGKGPVIDLTSGKSQN